MHARKTNTRNIHSCYHATTARQWLPGPNILYGDFGLWCHVNFVHETEGPYITELYKAVQCMFLHSEDVGVFLMV